MLANMTVEEIMGNLTQAAFTEPEQSLDTMYGAPFIGVIIASLCVVLPLERLYMLTIPSSLFGVTSLQAYWYFHHYPRDPLKQKLSVRHTIYPLPSMHSLSFRSARYGTPHSHSPLPHTQPPHQVA